MGSTHLMRHFLFNLNIRMRLNFNSLVFNIHIHKNLIKNAIKSGHYLITKRQVYNASICHLFTNCHCKRKTLMRKCCKGHNEEQRFKKSVKTTGKKVPKRSSDEPPIS